MNHLNLLLNNEFYTTLDNYNENDFYNLIADDFKSDNWFF